MDQRPNLRGKFIAIAAAYGISGAEFCERLKAWHHGQLMSCAQIVSIILDETRISASERSVNRWLTAFGIQRTHESAMMVRIRTGRMNFRSRKFDYGARYIDYARRDMYPRQGRALKNAMASGSAAYSRAKGAAEIRMKGDAARLHRFLRNKGHRFAQSTVFNWIRGQIKVPPQCQQDVADFFSMKLSDCFPK